ncbi:hypothetical protein ACA910_018195 [Epithemia clementina (nom. ined.)]
MVGMQASLHTPTEDSLSDLMKSGNMDGCGMQGGIVHGMSGSPIDLEGDDADDDDFNAEELLKSPLFNDSAEKLVTDEVSFGDFGASDGGGDVSSRNMIPNQTGRPKRDFVPMGLRRSDDTNFAAMKQHQLQQAQMPGSYGGNERDNLYGDIGSQQQSYPSSRMDSGYVIQDRFTAQGNGMPQFNSYRGGNHVMDDNSQNEFAFDDGNVSMMNPYLSQSNNNNSRNQMYGAAPERSSSNASSSYESDASPVPRAAGSAMLDISQGSHISNNGMDVSQNSAMFRRAAPQRSQTYHPVLSRNSLEMMKEQQLRQQQEQQQQFGLGDGGDGNQLEMMQQHLQQMQDVDQFELQLQQQQQNMGTNSRMPGMGMARSMNVPARSASCGPMGGFNDGLGGAGSFNGFNNMDRAGAAVQLPSDLEAMQNELSAPHVSGSRGGNNNGSSGPLSVNDAMEKLCESMKRSAMSRTLVKQFSSGARGVSRNNSAGMMMGGRQNVRRSSSNRAMPLDDNSHRSSEGRPAVPMRRVSNTKHQLQGRGVYRHGSGHLSGVNNMGNSNISLQIDGRNMGSL